MSHRVYIVAVLLEQKSYWTKSLTVEVGLFRADSPLEAKDLATKEFATDGRQVTAWTGGLLSDLESYYLGTGEVPVVEG